MSPTTANKRGGFFISVGCPGCGGKLELEDSFFVLTCDFCGSVLRVHKPDVPPAYVVSSTVDKREVRFAIDHHLKKQGQPLTGSDIQYKRVLYPYWRIEAIVLKTRNRARLLEDRKDYNYGHGSLLRASCLSSGHSIKEKHTEVTLSPYTVTSPAAYEVAGIPYTLGMRTNYLKVMPFVEGAIDERFDVLPVTVPMTMAVQQARKSVQSVGMVESADFGRNLTELYHPVGSVVYFPYFLAESLAGGIYRRWIVDGVTARILGHQERPVEVSMVDVPMEPLIEFGQLEISHHRCSNCGEDLPEENSYIYICKNCHKLTNIEPHPLFRTELQVTSDSGSDGDLLLPFWSLKFSEQVQSSLRVSNPDRLIVPAFQMSNFEEVFKLSRRMATAVSRFTFASLTDIDRNFRSIDISPSEALVMAQVLCVRERLSISANIDMPDISSTLAEMSLFFVPFHPEHYFMLDSILGAVTFSKRVLARH
ncbi:MAG: hypothetical protein DRP47_04455 [Candidatus Zixiibacteriota bacterium]|nr:MAG: hypothetical protein DRP47_04455 [candidate division Zixibacteria bacterium]